MTTRHAVVFSVEPDTNGHPAAVGLAVVGPRLWLFLESSEGNKGVHLSRSDVARLIRELDSSLQLATLEGAKR
jgi:hypothetical protein